MLDIYLIYIFAPQGNTIIDIDNTRFHTTSCAFYDVVSPFQSNTELTQITMVAQYIDYTVLHGSVCSIITRSDTKIYACSCSSFINNLAVLLRYPKRILDTCRNPVDLLDKNKNFFSKEMICGSVLFTKEPNTKVTLEIKVPSRLALNITLWQIRSVAVSNLRDCQYVSSLILQDRDFYQEDYLNTNLCGTYPSHSIFSKTNRVSATWQTRILRQESPLLILSYQSIAQGYVQAYIPSEPEQEYNAKRYRVELQEDQALEAFVIKVRNAICIFRRDRNLDRTIWWAIQSILSLPEIFITDFSCNIGNTQGTHISLYDGLFLPEGAQLNMDNYLMEKVKCSDDFVRISFRSTMGDLTVRLDNKIGERITFNGTVTYAKMLCPGRYCNISTSNISQGREIKFLLSSDNETVHKRFLISSDINAYGFILLSNITLFYEGYTLLPCIYGGIYVYELDPLSLVTKICTSWTSHILDGGVKHKDGSKGLYFGRSAVLILVRAIRFLSRGYIRGVASLTPCAGVINMDFRKTNIYTVPGRGYIKKGTMVSYLGRNVDMYYTRIEVHHNNGCLMVQFVSRDDLKLSKPTEVVIVLVGQSWHIGKAIHEQTIGFSVSYSSGIIILRNLNKHNLCEFFSGEPKTETTDFSQPFWETKRSHIYYASWLISGSDCYLFGIKIAWVMSYERAGDYGCQIPSHLPQWFTFEDGSYAVNSQKSCGMLSLTGNMKGLDYNKVFSIYIGKPYENRCCLLRINVLADVDFYDDIETLYMDIYWPQFSFTWQPFWKFQENKNADPIKTIFDLQSSPTNRRLNLLGRVWTLNCLHYKSGLSLELGDKSSSLTDFRLEPLMNISFHFTVFVDIHDWVGSNTPRDKTDNNTFCSENIGKCYFFFVKNHMSWNMDNDLCVSNGMALLNTPSDLEWNFIETLLIKDTSIFNRKELYLLGFLHLYRTGVSSPLK